MLRVRLPILTTVLLASMASASPLVAQEQEPYLNGPPPGQVPLEVEIGFNLVNLTDVNEQNGIGREDRERLRTGPRRS